LSLISPTVADAQLEKVWVGGRTGAVRATVLDILRDQPGLTVVEHDFDAADDDTHGPSAMVCDLEELPKATALRARLRARSGERCHVVCVLGGDAREDVRRAVTAGADSVVAEGGLRRTLVPALHATLAGLLAVPATLRHAIDAPSLTNREKQILALVVMGFSNREIADRLVVSESTVKSHLFSAFRRLGVRTRREAISLILDPSRGYGSGILGITEKIGERDAT
jgi:DNA-binding NarL/FixJ family response regulator